MSETSETLDQALSRVWEHDWKHRRSGPTLRSQAEIAANWVARVAGRGWPEVARSAHNTTARDIQQADIQLVTADWYASGLAPATIQKRLNCLSKLGVNVEGCRVKVPKQLKWHLPEDKRLEVADWCSRNDYHRLSRLILWTTRTGLRIEESLRLRPEDFRKVHGPIPDTWGIEGVSVPGTKTASSQAVLPLSAAAIIPVIRAIEEGQKPFPGEYTEYQTQWDHVREHFGWQDDPTATLKALRRSAARYLHVDCGMPLHMVQQYLRHESMNTTLEYLRLTGGYGTEEMRKYLR